MRSDLIDFSSEKSILILNSIFNHFQARKVLIKNRTKVDNQLFAKSRTMMFCGTGSKKGVDKRGQCTCRAMWYVGTCIAYI